MIFLPVSSGPSQGRLGRRRAVIDHPETESDANQREVVSAGQRRFKCLDQAGCLVSQKILSVSRKDWCIESAARSPRGEVCYRGLF